MEKVEIIPDRLFFLSLDTPLEECKEAIVVNIDDELVYDNYYLDFGPLDLGKTHRFCQKLDGMLNEHPNTPIIHVSGQQPEKRANAAVLMGAFQIIVLKRTAEEAWAPFSNLPRWMPFRDASEGECTYDCTVFDWIQSIETAIRLGWYDYSTFKLQEYELRTRMDRGDFNWIISGKLLAVSSPSSKMVDSKGYRNYTPEDYNPVFRRIGITSIVRLNEEEYDRSKFIKAGIHHYELYFLDGSCPEDEIVDRFLEIWDSESGVAVHCKAGLGRTGTLIGCYALKNFDITAREFIAWCRLCRPGSVIGPQQEFLLEYEQKIQGKTDYQIEKTADSQNKAIYGEAGQASKLLRAKKTIQKARTVD